MLIQETEAISQLLEATDQHIAIQPFSITGGISGFETNKRQKVAQATSMNLPCNDLTKQKPKVEQVDHQNDHQVKDPITQQKANFSPMTRQANSCLPPQVDQTPTTSAESHSTSSSLETKLPKEVQRDEVDSPRSIASHSGNHELLNQEDVPMVNSSQDVVQMPSQEDETMVIFVKHEESNHPMPYTVAKNMTVGRLTHAEARLGSFELPIAPRSLVGTHVPLDAEMHPNQYVILHQQMPQNIRCPFVSSKFSNQTQVDLGLPCTRFEALWRQQAWVANDEMDYYLEAVQMEDKALPFPTAFTV
eukprot:s1474_g8.t1